MCAATCATSRRPARPSRGAVCTYSLPWKSGEVRYIAPNDPVLGYVADDGQAYAYSLGILNFHEIVNDTLAAVPSSSPIARSAAAESSTSACWMAGC